MGLRRRRHCLTSHAFSCGWCVPPSSPYVLSWDSTSWDSLRLRRHQSPSPPKPHSGGIASGAGSQTWPQSPHPPAILTLCLQPKSSPFLRDYSIQLARIRPGLFVPADGGRGRDQGPVRILAYRTETRTSAFRQLAREESLVSNRSGMAETFQGVPRIDISEFESSRPRQPVRLKPRFSPVGVCQRDRDAGDPPFGRVRGRTDTTREI
jgi:hypothetical protein